MSPKKKSKLDDRLGELEQEAERVRSDIKSLSKALKRPVVGHLPELQSKFEIRPSPHEVLERPTPKEAADESSSPTMPHAPGRDLFSWSKTQEAERLPESASPDAPVSPAAPAPVRSKESARSTLHDYRFLSYLSNKGFSAERAPRQHRSVQRNKAIFMIVVVAITLYVVIKLLLR